MCSDEGIVKIRKACVEKFDEISQSLARIEGRNVSISKVEEKVNKIHETIVGNGKIGLTTRVHLIEQVMENKDKKDNNRHKAYWASIGSLTVMLVSTIIGVFLSR